VVDRGGFHGIILASSTNAKQKTLTTDERIAMLLALVSNYLTYLPNKEVLWLKLEELYELAIHPMAKCKFVLIVSRISMYTISMQLGQVQTIISNHQSDLEALGVQRLFIVGSVARGEANLQSDIDFIVELNNYTFRNFMGLKFALETWLNVPVDLSTFESLKPLLRQEVEKDLRRVA
jgi:uncharacterized protein